MMVVGHMPQKNVTQPMNGNNFWCDCNLCKASGKIPDFKQQDHSLMQRIVDIDLMQKIEYENFEKRHEFKKKYGFEKDKGSTESLPFLISDR